MKLKFLGTAAATSMPLVFCNCNTCKQGRINKGKDIRKRSSVIINDEMIIDLSPDITSSAVMYDVDLGNIKYLIQTHSHTDHFDAGHFVTRWSEYKSENLTHMNIICSKGTCDDMNHWIKENEPSIDIYSDTFKRDMNYDLHILKHGDKVKLDNYEIIAIDSKHDSRIESLIYIISYRNKNILYGTDLLELSSEAWYIINDYKLDLVILDQTYGKECNSSGGHLNVDNIVNIINIMRKENIINSNTKVYATHLSHEGNSIHEETERLANLNGYNIAYDGLQISL